MTTDEHLNGDNRYRDALARIAAIAASVTTENGETAEADTDIGCRIKVLPPRLRERAAANARGSTRSTRRCRHRWAARHRSTRSG